MEVSRLGEGRPAVTDVSTSRGRKFVKYCKNREGVSFGKPQKTHGDLKKCEIISNAELEYSKSISELPGTEKTIFYVPKFARYVLDNWCGILPMWTSFHLGDQVVTVHQLHISNGRKSSQIVIV